MFLNLKPSQAGHDLMPVGNVDFFFLLLFSFSKQVQCVHVGCSADPSLHVLLLACFFSKGLCYRTIEYTGNATKKSTAYNNNDFFL